MKSITDLSPTLLVESEFEMGRRSRPAGLIYVGLFFVLLKLTTAHLDHPLLTNVSGAAIFLLAGLRTFLAYSQKAFYPLHRRLWQSCFRVSVLGGAMAWGAFVGTVFYLDGPSRSAVYALLTGLGICAGATASMFPDLFLIRGYLALLILPIMACGIAQARGAITPLPFFSALFLGFLWVQVGQYNREYWKSLRIGEFAKAQRDQLQAILDAIPGYVAWIGQNREIVGMNRRMADVRREVERNREFREKISAFMASSAKLDFSEMRLHTPSGVRWTLLGLCKYSIGEATSAIIIGIDVEDRKSAEQRLEVARTNAQHASKMRLVGELAEGMGHEINNPLTVMMLTLEDLRETAQKGPVEQTRLLNTVGNIEEQVGRISRIIAAVRAFAHDDAGEPLQLVSLNKIVEDTLDLCRSKHRATGVTMRVQDCPPGLKIEARLNQISQVLLNLLSNAVDAAETHPEKWVSVDFRDNPDWVEISVTDSGHGIPPELREKVFNPFFTTKEIGKGTGLGLSVSKGIVENHGGTIMIDVDCPNTRFVVRLPKKQPKKTQLAA